MQVHVHRVRRAVSSPSTSNVSAQGRLARLIRSPRSETIVSSPAQGYYGDCKRVCSAWFWVSKLTPQLRSIQNSSHKSTRNALHRLAQGQLQSSIVGSSTAQKQVPGWLLHKAVNAPGPCTEAGFRRRHQSRNRLDRLSFSERTPDNKQSVKLHTAIIARPTPEGVTASQNLVHVTHLDTLPPWRAIPSDILCVQRERKARCLRVRSPATLGRSDRVYLYPWHAPRTN